MGALLSVLTLIGCGVSDRFIPAPGQPPGGDAQTTQAPVAESEPNEGAATAARIPTDVVALGDVRNAGDVDYWSFEAVAAEVITIELFATRLDQSRWDLERNTPRLRLIDTDGTTTLLTHDSRSTAWDFGRHDLDVPLFRIPTDGTYYVCIAQDDPDAPGGAYALRIQRSPGSDDREEQEARGTSGANDNPDDAEPIQPGLLHGFHAGDDSDLFAFTIAEPTFVYAEVVAYRNGRYRDNGDYFDPVLSLLDGEGEVLQRNDDAYFFDSALSHRLESPGTYYLRMEGRSPDIEAPYAMRFGLNPAEPALESQPNDGPSSASVMAYGDAVDGTTSSTDPDWFTFEGTAGDMIQLWVFDFENLEGALADVEIEFFRPDGLTRLPSSSPQAALPVARTILQESGRHFVRVRSVAPTTYNLSLRRLKQATFEDLETANDSIATAVDVDSRGRAAGIMEDPGDQDVFRFTAERGELVQVSVYAERGSGSNGFAPLAEHGSDLEPALTVLDSTGMPISYSAYDGPNGGGIGAEGVAAGLPTISVALVAHTSGEYYVVVEDQDGDFGPDYHYLLEVR